MWPAQVREPGACGCRAVPRWRCPLCSERGEEHLACSRVCLDRHRDERHGLGPAEAVGLSVRWRLAAHNREGAGNWETFAEHRGRLGRLLNAVQRGEGLCVLGAGNGDDLDLPALVRLFGEVHLVDLDGAALERARARVPAAVAARIVLHGDVDLSGLLDTVERWGDDAPVGIDGAAAIAAPAVTDWAAAIATRLGRTFDVVLSSCVLSQLCTPFTQVLARRGAEWTALMARVGRSHLELMARLVRPGGHGIALGDLYFGPAHAPPAQPPTWEALPPPVLQAMREAVMRLRDPVFLAELLTDPAVRPSIASARLGDPWLWHVEKALMLVYPVVFQCVD